MRETSNSASALWFRFSKLPFTGSEPSFFKTDREEWHKQIEQGFDAIREELMQFIEQPDAPLKEYRFNPNPPKPQWLTFPLISWNYVHRKNISLLPKSYALFSQIPGLVSVSVSCLTAGSSVHPHHGDTNGIYRCHLGLLIPGKIPECGFTVREESKSWEEGKLLAFCDAHWHYATNQTPHHRYILIIDVIRPEFSNRTNEICSRVIGSHLLYILDGYLPLYSRGPSWLWGSILGVFATLSRLLIR